MDYLCASVIIQMGMKTRLDSYEKVVKNLPGKTAAEYEKSLRWEGFEGLSEMRLATLDAGSVRQAVRQGQHLGAHFLPLCGGAIPGFRIGRERIRRGPLPGTDPLHRFRNGKAERRAN